MSFYGVTDATSRDERQTRRSCHSLDQPRAGRGRPSDRGMVHPPVRMMKPQAKQTSNLTAAIVLSLLADTRYPPGIECFEGSQPNCDCWRRVKKGKKIGARRVRSLDIGGHIGVRHESVRAFVRQCRESILFAIKLTTRIGHSCGRRLQQYHPEVFERRFCGRCETVDFHVCFHAF